MVSNKKAKQARREAELAAIRGKRGSGKPRDWFTITMSMVVVVFVLGVGGFLTWMNIQSSMYSSADASTLSAKGTVYDGFFIDDRGIKVPEGLDGTPYEFKDAVWEASPYPTEIGNTIDLYVDSSCPHCYNFWQQNEGQITEWLNNGTIFTRLHSWITSVLLVVMLWLVLLSTTLLMLYRFTLTLKPFNQNMVKVQVEAI
jgi:hypothetical protein